MLALEGAGPENVTDLLRSWSDGDADAMHRLFPIIYKDLQKIASVTMRRERGDHTLQPTALVHEAFLRLVDQKQVRWQDRQQFFALVARIMRRVLVTHARSRGSLKRGANPVKVALTDAKAVESVAAPSIVALDDALSALEEVDPEKARIVELKFFVGLSTRETAELIGRSEKTVRRHWKVAQVRLYRELTRSMQGED
jgi:RNA polymerase sigma factor (TIGR02999 family)